MKKSVLITTIFLIAYSANAQNDSLIINGRHIAEETRQVLTKLEQKITLTDEQKPKVTAAITDYKVFEAQEVQKDPVAKVSNSMLADDEKGAYNKLLASLQSILSQDQLKVFKRFYREQKRKMHSLYLE